MTALTVVVADDHGVVRSGLRALLATVDDIEVVGDAATGTEAIRLVDDHLPDVVLMDVQMPDGDGIALVRQIRELCPSTKCVIYTSVTLADHLKHDADAVVIKALFEDKLIETIRELRDNDA